MILRIWTASVAPEREAEYLAYVSTHSRAMFTAQPGCLGVLFTRTADGRHSACSLWDDQHSIDDLRESPTYRSTVERLSALGVLLGPQEVAIHRIDSGWLNAEAVATALGNDRVG
jgi:quinol monooxygenase YgiN